MTAAASVRNALTRKGSPIALAMGLFMAGAFFPAGGILPGAGNPSLGNPSVGNPSLSGSLLSGQALAADARPRQKDLTHTSGLPIPRFVTLRSGEVNARTGPNVRYPIEWVFVRKNMPVEITQEFDTWRRIRDWEGSEGWVHQSMLVGKRTVVVMGDTRELHREANPNSPVVARAEPGVMGWLHRCQLEWCEVDLEGYRGWTMRAGLWGVYPNEVVQ